MGEPRYQMLMASLPYHGKLFGARQTPLSRFQLDKRLAWLDEADAAVLTRIENVLQWRRQLLEETDSEFLRQAEDVVTSLENSLLREVVCSRLEIRTLIASLRLRIHGMGAPGPGQRFGFGRWVDVIRRHWSEPEFGLGNVYPWIRDADEKLRMRDALGLERLFLGHAWEVMSRYGAGHYFDFEAVAIYVLRWDLIDRWTHYNAAGAKANILDLVDNGLGSHARIYH